MLVPPGSQGLRRDAERGSRGQVLQTRQSQALQEHLRCRKRHELETPEFHDVPALVGVEELVDFRMANRLLKSHACEHLECCGRKIKTRA